MVTRVAFSILNPLAIETAVVRRHREYPMASSMMSWAATRLRDMKKALHKTQIVGSASDGRIA